MKKQSIIIGKRKIGPCQPVFIIAEAGVNHNGSLRLAKKLIDAAKKAGADAIKFQAYRTEELVTKSAPKAAYQKKTAQGKSQYVMLQKLELSALQFGQLFSYCKEEKIIFLATPFDLLSAEFLYKLGQPVFKISSGDLTNIPLLQQVAKFGRPIILSTGMSALEEIRDAVSAIYAAGNKKLVLLHCTSNYPARYANVNLRAMATLAKKFKVPVGYSDHTLGIEVSVAAVSLGACVIEKHFTLDKEMSGPDHKASLVPEELTTLVQVIRNVEQALGSAEKKPTDSEKEVAKVARKSVVAAIDIAQGTIITSQMLSIKRPGTGIEPKCFGKIVGRQAKKQIGRDEVLTWEEVAL